MTKQVNFDHFVKINNLRHPKLPEVHKNFEEFASVYKEVFLKDSYGSIFYTPEVARSSGVETPTTEIKEQELSSSKSDVKLLNVNPAKGLHASTNSEFKPRIPSCNIKQIYIEVPLLGREQAIVGAPAEHVTVPKENINFEQQPTMSQNYINKKMTDHDETEDEFEAFKRDTHTFLEQTKKEINDSAIELEKLTSLIKECKITKNDSNKDLKSGI